MSKSCDLTSRRCVPCEGGVPKLSETEAAALAVEVPGWSLSGDKLHKELRFADFAAAMRFVNRMAALAEREGHHPNFSVDYSRVQVSIWTHAIGGLSENDFILAAKLDTLPLD